MFQITQSWVFIEYGRKSCFYKNKQEQVHKEPKMGLAASQARLLLLTARKSDLEFRAQQITNSEMILAMQTEEIAREYSNKLSNQTLKYINSADQTEVEITAANLSDLSATGMKLQIIDENGQWQDWVSDGTKTITGYQDEDGNVITPDEYNTLGDDIKSNYKEIYVMNNETNNYSGPQILEGINGGTMRIVTAAGVEVDAINGTGFSVAYDTSDDAQADAEYRSKTASIQIKEKRLQMDLQQVETQQKACDTEIESVKKVMDKNIEKTFKVFS